jgi:hypothetical protein
MIATMADGGRDPESFWTDEDRLERLRLCLPEQHHDALIHLSAIAPEVFDQVMDAVDPCGEDAGVQVGDEAAPVCELCGANVGIFLRRGPEWRHFRGPWEGPCEVYETGHQPLVTWRPVAAG